MMYIFDKRIKTSIVSTFSILSQTLDNIFLILV